MYKTDNLYLDFTKPYISDEGFLYQLEGGEMCLKKVVPRAEVDEFMRSTIR